MRYGVRITGFLLLLFISYALGKSDNGRGRKDDDNGCTAEKGSLESRVTDFLKVCDRLRRPDKRSKKSRRPAEKADNTWYWQRVGKDDFTEIKIAKMEKETVLSIDNYGDAQVLGSAKISGAHFIWVNTSDGNFFTGMTKVSYYYFPDNDVSINTVKEIMEKRYKIIEIGISIKSKSLSWKKKGKGPTTYMNIRKVGGIKYLNDKDEEVYHEF